jgi:hypothetical protein
MAISLSTLRQQRGDGPPRLVIYGPPKIGKTTLASEFPAPVFLFTEDGTPSGLTTTGWRVHNFSDVMGALEALDNQDHDFKTIVVDNLSDLQRFVWAETCDRGDEKGFKKARIEDFGYGKGYVNALNVWQEVLDGLNALRNERGMSFILVSHSIVSRIDDPETVSYSRHQLDLNDKAAGFIHKGVDAILLVKRDIKITEEDKGFNKTRAVAKDGSTPWIYTVDRAAYLAGNRYNMPERIIFKPGEGYKAIAPYFPSLPQPKPVQSQPAPRKKAA